MHASVPQMHASVPQMRASVPRALWLKEDGWLACKRTSDASIHTDIYPSTSPHTPPLTHFVSVCLCLLCLYECMQVGVRRRC